MRPSTVNGDSLCGEGTQNFVILCKIGEDEHKTIRNWWGTTTWAMASLSIRASGDKKLVSITRDLAHLKCEREIDYTGPVEWAAAARLYVVKEIRPPHHLQIANILFP